MKKVAIAVLVMISLVLYLVFWACIAGVISNIILLLHGGLNAAYFSFEKYVGIGFLCFVFTLLFYGRADEMEKN